MNEITLLLLLPWPLLKVVQIDYSYLLVRFFSPKNTHKYFFQSLINYPIKHNLLFFKFNNNKNNYF